MEPFNWKCDGGGCFVLWGGEQGAVQEVFTGIRSVAVAGGTGSLPVLCLLLCD